MFDVGFWELVLLGVIALIVLGPERLPEVARTAGRWVGRARNYASGLTQELESHSGVSDIRDEIKRTRDEVNDVGERIKADTRGAMDDVESAAQSVHDDAQESLQAAEASESSDSKASDHGDDDARRLEGFDDVDAYVDDYLKNTSEDLAEYADDEPFSVDKAREEHARRDRESEA